MKVGKVLMIGFVLSAATVWAEDRKPFGSTELFESIRLVTEKFQKEKGVELSEGAVNVSAQRTAKGATVTIVYEEAGKGKVYSLPCHQHSAGDIDCH
jgi:hypothetical protein